MKHNSPIVFLGLILASCGGKTKDDSQRSGFNPADEAVQVEVVGLRDDGGQLKYPVLYTSPNTQVVRPTEGSVAGTVIYFKPGSFDVDQEVTLQAGRSLATKGNLTQLIDDKTTTQALGPAVYVDWTYDMDALRQFKVELPVPPSPQTQASLGLTTESMSLIVLYLRNDAEGEGFRLGFYPPSQLKFGDGLVTFETASYGLYQAAWINAVPTKTNEVKTIKGIEKLDASSPPIAFNVNVLTKPMYAKLAKVSWELSELADEYEVLLSSKGADCASPYKTYPSVKALSTIVEFQSDGDNYICVNAKNSKGKTAGTGSGMKIKSDPLPPKTPSKPVSAGGNNLDTINITFSWAAVDDQGSSGLNHYVLQIGSTPGGSDVFNGSVGDELSQYITGDNGKIYYARVKAVDKIGNESDWSPVSDKVTVNTD